MRKREFVVARRSSVLGGHPWAVLRNAMVDSRSWVILHEGRAIFPWSIHTINTIVGRPWTNAFKFMPGEVVEVIGIEDMPVIPQERAVLAGGNYNVYHYTVDHLGNTYHTLTGGEELASLPMLADARLPWQRELVECYTAEGPAVISSTDEALYLVDELYLPKKCFDYDGHNLVPEWAPWARSRTSHLAPAPASLERVYISRSRSRMRRLENEPGLEKALSDIGFCTVRPEEMAFSEQIRLFKGVSVAVGPTGAGFTNMAYAQPGSHVVEFMPRDSWKPPQIERLMRASGMKYSNLEFPGKFEDESFRVDVGAIIEHLGGLGIT